MVLLGTVLLSAGGGTGQTPGSNYDPAASRRAGPQKSFLDWTLGRINPRDINYGDRIEEMRQRALDATVRDVGFWADATAVLVLGVAFVVIYWQYRQIRRLKFTTADLLVAYHNDLTALRNRFDQLLAEYNLIKQGRDERPEKIPVPRPQPLRLDSAASRNIKPPSNSNGGTPAPTEDGNVQQQLVHANETIGSLRRQVSTLSKRVEQQQQQSRKLRGE